MQLFPTNGEFSKNKTKYQVNCVLLTDENKYQGILVNQFNTKGHYLRNK